MGVKVVHHDDVTAPALGQPLGLEPVHEPVLVRLWNIVASTTQPVGRIAPSR
jgi:hypothetical protein